MSRVGNTTATLTAGEAFYVARRRAGKTQRQLARRYAVPLGVIHKWEADVAPLDAAGTERPIPRSSLVWADLTAAERCVVLRRRSGMSRALVAADLGVSEQWLSAMEAGREKPSRLLRYWRLPDGGAA